MNGSSRLRTTILCRWCPVCQLWCSDPTKVGHAATNEHVRGLMTPDDVWV